jgi:uncharacterized coiled-coil protein SlyX
MAALVKHGRQASEGDLTALEALLAAQDTTLNAMFTQLAGLAAKQTLVDPMDRLARLALNRLRRRGSAGQRSRRWRS